MSIELTEETKKACDAIAYAIDQAISHEDSKKEIDKFVDCTVDRIYDFLKSYLVGDIGVNIQYHIEQNVRDIIRKILIGDKKAIESLGITFSFNCMDIRQAIWESCSVGIENKLIEDLQDEIVTLKSRLKYAEERYY